jgi:TolB-like protein/Tfp pilus assembly protein PilF
LDGSSITESPDATAVIQPTATAVTRTETPSTWRHLTVLELVGRGGFGAVHRAWDSRLDKEVALKLIPAGTTALLDAAIGGEARRLARVRHPNVVTIHGADSANGQFGLWMEFVRGRTLRQIIEERGPFGAHEALTLGAEVARALAAVHAAGFVHRDLKAHNVMREDGGRVVLMDFGAGEDLASTAPRRITGTPVYMAPELFADQRATPQSDIYSLGVLLFYLVTGKYPVSGRSWAEVGAAHNSGQRLLLRDLRPDLPAAFVECVEAMTAPDPAKRTQTAGAAEAALQRVLVGESPRRWGIVAAAAAALVVAALAIGANFSSLRDRFWSAGVQRIAVLPIANWSGDAGRDYFVDGMTDQLIAELSRISALRVTDRTSVMGYKQTTKRLNEIARELGVDAVLESSIVLSGSNLRMTAALIRAADGRRLWFKTYDKSLKDALILQAELTRDLASSIRLALTSGERHALEQPYYADEAAQDAYMRGRDLLHRADRSRIKESCAFFEQAVTLDPKYALAWASLSRCLVFMENYGLMAAAEAAPLVKHAAETAIAEDASLAEAHIALADARFKFDWDWRGASESYEQAVALNSSLSFGHEQYAQFLAAAGRVDDAASHARRAAEADPLSGGVRRTLALMLFYQRRYQDALVKADEASKLEPAEGVAGTMVIRARTLAALERYDEALQTLERARTLTGDDALLAEVGRVHASAGRPDLALAVLQQLRAAAGPADLPHPQDSAYILVALGRLDEAMTYLERAVDKRSTRILWVRVDPRVDALRNHPLFGALLSRIGGLD